MPDPIVHEGKLHAYYVPTIANKAAPTLAEIGAGVNLTDQLVADGVSPSHTENTVSTDMLSGFIRQSVGTEGVTFSLTLLKLDSSDNAYGIFDARGKAGHLVLSYNGPADTAGDVVEVYPATFGRRKRVASGANAHQKFSVLVAVGADYDDDAVVAA